MAAVRREHGISIDGLAERVGIPPSAIARYEAGSLQSPEHETRMSTAMRSLAAGGARIAEPPLTA